jgi:hypothetical protein
MSVTLEDLARRLQALEDINAIKALMSHYFRCCDRQDPDEVRDCFDPDGVTIDFEGFPPYDNRDDFAAMFKRLACVPNIVDMHHGQNPEVTLTGPDTASGKWDLFFFQIETETRRLIQLSVRYDNDFVRKNGRWYLKKCFSRQNYSIVRMVGDDGRDQIVSLRKPGVLEFGPTISVFKE